MVLLCHDRNVNYFGRKVHTESSKKWLERLHVQIEKVPVLVCLTFADKLYAEHMREGKHLTDDTKYPDKRYMTHLLKAELAVSLNSFFIRTALDYILYLQCTCILITMHNLFPPLLFHNLPPFSKT